MRSAAVASALQGPAGYASRAGPLQPPAAVAAPSAAAVADPPHGQRPQHWQKAGCVPRQDQGMIVMAPYATSAPRLQLGLEGHGVNKAWGQVHSTGGGGGGGRRRKVGASKGLEYIVPGGSQYDGRMGVAGTIWHGAMQAPNSEGGQAIRGGPVGRQHPRPLLPPQRTQSQELAHILRQIPSARVLSCNTQGRGSRGGHDHVHMRSSSSSRGVFSSVQGGNCGGSLSAPGTSLGGADLWNRSHSLPSALPTATSLLGAPAASAPTPAPTPSPHALEAAGEGGEAGAVGVGMGPEMDASAMEAALHALEACMKATAATPAPKPSAAVAAASVMIPVGEAAYGEVIESWSGAVPDVAAAEAGKVARKRSSSSASLSGSMTHSKKGRLAGAKVKARDEEG